MKKQNGIVKNSLFLSLATFFLFLGRPCKAEGFARPRKSLFPVGKSLGKKAPRKSLFPVGKSLGKKAPRKSLFAYAKSLGKKALRKTFLGFARKVKSLTKKEKN